MQEGIKYVISADVKQAVKGINDVQAGLKKLPGATNNATFALTNFSRVVQDAPFGIIGIANNIDPLVQSFINLKKETGSVKGALGALAGSLTGGGGLILAVSLVTSALSFLALQKQKVKKEAAELNTVEDEYSKILAKEKVNLDNLFAIATNANAPLLARKQAIKELRDQYSAYLKDFSDEEILAGKATEAYNKLSAAIGKVALARAAANIQTENNEKILRTQLDIDKQRVENDQELIKQRANVLKAINSFNDKTDPTGGRRKSLGASLAVLEDQIKQKGYDKIIEKQKVVNKLSEENLKLTKLILENQVDPFKESKIDDKTGKVIEKNNKLLQDQDLIIKSIGSGYERISSFAELTLRNSLKTTRELTEQEKLLQKLVLKNLPAQKNGLGITDDPNAQRQTNKQLDPSALDALQNIDGITKKASELSNIINGGINSGIDQFFNAIANNQDPFEALAQSVKRLVVELTAAVVKALLLKAITSVISGGASAGAGGLAGLAGGGAVRGDILRLAAFGR